MAHQWTNEDPGSVELGCMSSATTDLTNASSKYSSTATSVTATSNSVGAWSGQAADAWKSAASTLVGDLGEHRGKILDGKSAISSYRSTCLSISNRAATVLADINSAQRTMNEDAPRLVGDDYDAWQREYQQHQQDQSNAQYELQDLRSQLAGLAWERQDADDAAVSALQGAVPDNWADTAAWLAAVGIDSPSDLTRQKVIDAMVSLADTGQLAMSRDALQILLDMYGNNESVLSEFFTELGGERTLRLIDEIGDILGDDPGPEVSATLLLLAGTVRSALSLASSNWTASEAETFASQMISNETLASTDLDGNAAIAYLFSNSIDSPMGEELALATAKAIDFRERVDGLPLNNLALSPNELPWSGGTVLMFAENPNLAQRMPGGHTGDYRSFFPSEDYVFFYVDAAGEVFQSLGRYPESAYEFIGADFAGDNPAEAQARIDYWYGGAASDASGIGHNWVADGFEGAAALWLGATQVEGGPVVGLYDGSEGGVGATEAWMSGAILEALAGEDRNPGFLTENLSDTAAIDFGAAITMHLDGISQAMVGGESVINSDGIAFITFTDPITGEVQVMRDLESETFMSIIGEVAANPGGGISLKAGADALSSDILAATNGNPGALPDAVDQVIRLQGVVDGGSAGASLGMAERTDEELREMVDQVTGAYANLAGFVSLPGGFLVGGTAGVIVDGATSAWADRWFSDIQTYPTADLRAEAIEAAGQARIERSVALMIYEQCGESLGLSAPPPSQAGEYVFDAWQQSTLDRLNDLNVDTNGIRDEYEFAFSAARGESLR